MMLVDDAHHCARAAQRVSYSFISYVSYCSNHYPLLTTTYYMYNVSYFSALCIIAYTAVLVVQFAAECEWSASLYL